MAASSIDPGYTQNKVIPPDFLERLFPSQFTATVSVDGAGKVIFPIGGTFKTIEDEIG
jgi:hypothetical protein